MTESYRVKAAMLIEMHKLNKKRVELVDKLSNYTERGALEQLAAGMEDLDKLDKRLNEVREVLNEGRPSHPLEQLVEAMKAGGGHVHVEPFVVKSDPEPEKH